MNSSETITSPIILHLLSHSASEENKSSIESISSTSSTTFQSSQSPIYSTQQSTVLYTTADHFSTDIGKEDEIESTASFLSG